MKIVQKPIVFAHCRVFPKPPTKPVEIAFSLQI